MTVAVVGLIIASSVGVHSWNWGDIWYITRHLEYGSLWLAKRRLRLGMVQHSRLMRSTLRLLSRRAHRLFKRTTVALGWHCVKVGVAAPVLLGL